VTRAEPTISAGGRRKSRDVSRRRRARPASFSHIAASFCGGAASGMWLAPAGRMAMTRSGLAVALMLGCLAAACSSNDGGAPTPTSPTPSTPAPSPTPGGTSSCLPAAPGNFRVVVNGTSRVFNWDAVSGVQDYFIQIATTGGPDLVNTNTTQTTYTWNGFSPASYWARVSARNACGSGASSTQIFFN
jgi:hypothetical protein